MFICVHSAKESKKMLKSDPGDKERGVEHKGGKERVVELSQERLRDGSRHETGNFGANNVVGCSTGQVDDEGASHVYVSIAATAIVITVVCVLSVLM